MQNVTRVSNPVVLDIPGWHFQSMLFLQYFITSNKSVRLFSISQYQIKTRALAEDVEEIDV